jgi:alkylated DNA repair protein alkB family protein 7
MHLASWPEEIDGLAPTLSRLHSLCPTPRIQTHLLHLASYGRILPHVDNISASGSWILGVSLGGERTLRMEGPVEEHGDFDIVLPSGSVYLQKCVSSTSTAYIPALMALRNSMRFTYNHSILAANKDGQDTNTSQRLSIMIRVSISSAKIALP